MQELDEKDGACGDGILLAVEVELENVLYAAMVTGTVGVIVAGFTVGRKILNSVGEIVLTVLDRKRQQMMKVKRFSSGLEEISELLGAVGPIETLSFVDHVYLYNGSNGGKIPAAGKQFTVACFMEFPSTPRPTYRGPINADKLYIDILGGVTRDGLACVNINSIPPESVLGYQFREEKIFEAMLWQLDVGDTSVTFAMVVNRTRSFTKEEAVTVSACVERVRAILQKNRPQY